MLYNQVEDFSLSPEQTEETFALFHSSVVKFWIVSFTNRKGILQEKDSNKTKKQQKTWQKYQNNNFKASFMISFIVVGVFYVSIRIAMFIVQCRS